MEALKLKIFNVLVDKITVSEFENWLYTSEEILGSLENNLLYFDVITINFRGKSWMSDLKSIVLNSLDSSYAEILEIKEICSKITSTKTHQETHKIINYLAQGFNYDTDYLILWELYRLKDYFDYVEDGFCYVGNIEIEAKFYSEQVIKIIQETREIDNIKVKLELALQPFNLKNTH